MKYRIIHTTTYNYTKPVKLSPQIIRLTPKNARHLMVHHYNLSISPKPSLLYSIEETDGTLPAVAYFSEKLNRLHIEHTSEVSLSTYNPFNFLFNPDVFAKVPYPSMIEDYPDVAPFIKTIAVSDDLKEFIETVAHESNYLTISFTLNLCARIAKSIVYTKRISGEPQTADETFRLKTGSCRDLSYIFLVACMYMKIPARFVSGYSLWEGDEPDLHSWVEVYIPGGGWVAFDPTDGLASYGKHVPLAVSSEPTLTLPVTGYFVASPDVQSELSYSLKYELLEN